MYTHTHIHTYTSIKKNHIAVYLKLTQYFKLTTLQFNEKTRTTINLENNHQKKIRNTFFLLFIKISYMSFKRV